MTSPKDDFFTLLEKGVKDILKDKEATAAQKIQAITAGTKLLQVKHKITDPDGDDDNKSFFGKGK